MNRRVVLAMASAGVLVAGAGVGAALLHQRGESRADAAARTAAVAFASGWSARRLDQPGIRYAGRSPAEVAAGFSRVTGGLGTGPVTVKVASVDRQVDTAKATLDVSWTLAGGTTWSYTEPVTLKRTGEAWAVTAPSGSSLWYPGLGPTGTLSATHTWGKRGSVLDRSGSPLLTMGKVYDVQIDPARATTAAVTALEKIVDDPAGSLVAKLSAAQQSGSKAPIPVIAYRETDFRARQSQLDALPGIVYPPREQPLAATRTFGQPLLGSYGPVTAEMVKAGNGRYAPGDRAGISGLQGQYDELLGGTPGIAVTDSTRPDTPLFSRPAKDGTDLRLTLDPAVQTAAEKALTGAGSVPAALVALDVGTGDLLAVANSPSSGYDRALQGRYQPGSTLKVATTYSLLGKGLSPSTPVPCPTAVTVDGLRIQNYEGEAFGTVPFSTDFAQSCNTAFADLAGGMGDSDLHQAAQALGVDAAWARHLGVAGAFDGSIPPAASKTEKAASAFGQARTLASPTALGVMAASVARGSYIEPALISQPAVSGADRTPKPLDAKSVGELRQLMRLVVTSGTGQVLKSVPGAAVYGKTGTAEHGTATPPATRAWFVGWQGDVAFAVLVEEGRSGGTVAAPLAKAFLTNLR